MIDEQEITQSYNLVKRRYAELGVDVEAALSQFLQRPHYGIVSQAAGACSLHRAHGPRVGSLE